MLLYRFQTWSCCFLANVTSICLPVDWAARQEQVKEKPENALFARDASFSSLAVNESYNQIKSLSGSIKRSCFWLGVVLEAALKPEKCVLVFVRSGCDGSPHSSSALEVISIRQLTHLLVQHFGSEWNVSITVGWITTDCVPAWVLLYLLYSEPWTALTIVLFAFYYYY